MALTARGAYGNENPLVVFSPPVGAGGWILVAGGAQGFTAASAGPSAS